MTIRYPYDKEGLKAKEELCSLENRANGFKIRGLETAFDLAQIIKHLMIDKGTTLYNKSGGIQCHSGKLRTVEDLTITANSYGILVSFAKALKVVECLYKARLLTHSFCGTVLREVHSPTRLTTTAKEIRATLGKLNVKNLNYVKPKRKSTAISSKNK